MKKILVLFLTLLAISANCFAADDVGQFAAEQKMADAVVSALTGNSVSYEQISDSFTANMKQSFTPNGFANLKKQIKERIGTIKKFNFVSFTRQYNLKNGYNNVDDLVYYGAAGKEKYARLTVHFVEENGARRISSFDVNPINVAPQKGAAKK
jgi:hypothetical protein